VLGFRHTYEVPVTPGATFKWEQGYSWLPPLAVQAQRFFAVEGHLNGLGYMADSAGLMVAAPVIVADHASSETGNRTLGGRIVALDFDPEPGYWQSPDGIALIRQTAEYARQGPISLRVEMLYSAIRPGEAPVITVHLHKSRAQKPGAALGGEVTLQLLNEKELIATTELPVPDNGQADIDAPFHQLLPAGFYNVTAVYKEGGHAREFYHTGFVVTDRSALASGPVLGVHGDFLTMDGKPFLPVGTNYFTSEDNGWDFSSPRNVWIWDRDFAEMEAHGVSFVRTGVWMGSEKFIDSATGGPTSGFCAILKPF